MLISYSVKNFRSIRDKATLSLVKRNSIKDTECNTFFSGIDKIGDLQRSAIIYGYNGTGKSNVLRSAHVMRFLILESHRLTHGDEIGIEPFLLDTYSSKEPSSFEIDFLHEGIRYLYSFALTKERITHERLEAYPKGAKQVWFDRVYTPTSGDYQWGFSPQWKGERESIKNRTLENTLFLSKASHENHEMVKPLTTFFRDYFYISSNSSNTRDRSHTISLLETPEGKKKVLELLSRLDLGIDDLDIESSEPPEEMVLSLLSDEGKQIFKKNKIRKVEVKTVHNIPDSKESVTFDIDLHESTGTRKIFDLAGLIFNTLLRGGILFVDELERSLHCKLMSELVNLFHDPDFNRMNAQLIFSTHTPTVLDTTEFRRDQIWFTDKDIEKNTILYNLVEVPKMQGELKKIRREHSIAKGILDGKYYRPPAIDARQMKLFGDV